MKFLTDKLHEAAIEYLNKDSRDMRLKIFEDSSKQAAAERETSFIEGASLVGMSVMALHFLNTGMDNVEEIAKRVYRKDAEFRKLIKRSCISHKSQSEAKQYFRILEAVIIGS